jgi:hypothetical protein
MDVAATALHLVLWMEGKRRRDSFLLHEAIVCPVSPIFKT